MTRLLCCECRETKQAIVGWCEKDICLECYKKHQEKCALCNVGKFASIPAKVKR